MDMTIDQQVAINEDLVPHAHRLRIERSNFRLLSDISSKEYTLQLVYDVLRLTPFFKAFLVIADVLEIYMQEFWATATVHHHSIRFKMDNNKHIVNLESFREIGATRSFSDVNINKLHQPWRSFAAIINKCLTGKSLGYDSLRLSQAQILWGLYHKRNVDFAYLMWEDFVYQVKHKDTKKSNEMYYPRFTKVIIYHFMSKDPSIPRRNKVNWHYVRDDHTFTTIKLVSKHHNTQQFGAMLPIELTNADIRNSVAYKEYYAVTTGATPPKTKASVRKTKSSSDTTITPPTAAAAPRLSTSEKGKQGAKASKAKSLTALSEVAMIEAQQLKLATKRSLQQTHISQASGSGADEGTGDDDDDDKGDDGDDDDDAQDDDDQEDEGNDEDDQEEGSDDEQAFNEEEFIHSSLSTHDEEEMRDEESFDPIPKTPENTNDEGNGEENLGMNVGREEGQDEEDEEDELYRDVNINQGRGIESIFEMTSQMDVQTPTSVAPLPVSTQTLTHSTIATITTTQQAPTPPTTAPSTLLQDLPNFGSLFRFDHRLKILEANFSEFMQTNQFAGAVSSILEIVQRYMDQRMNEAVKVAVQIQSDRLHNEAQAENDEFLKTIDENMLKIIKEQVKEQVKVHVSKILSKIEQIVNEQLEAEFLTQSSNSSKTSYAVAADLSEMELKKILIEKMEGNMSIHRSNEQRNLYKALVKAYKSNKIILVTYGDTVTLKRCRDDADKDEEPSDGSDRGSKRQREGREPESASAPKEKATRSAGKSTQGSKSRQTSASESTIVEEPIQTTFEMQEPSHPEFEIGADDQPIVEPSQHPEWFSQPKKPPTLDRDWNKTFEFMDTLVDFSAFLMNRLKVDTLTPELLAGPTYELMKGSCKSASSRKYRTSFTKTKAVDYGHIKWIEDLVPRTMWIQELVGYDKHALWEISYSGRKCQQFYSFAVNRESARDVYSKRRIIAVIELKIVEWHNYKHLDWITVLRDNDKLYKFKEGDFKRLHIQDIEDILLLLVQGKLTNLTVEERFAFNFSLRMFTRSIRKEAYIAYSNPRGFIYQNKDKQNKLIRIDELHKFSDGTLIDVWSALDDCLKGIQMKYLPQTIWRKSDKETAAAMIQAIDKKLKTRRIMRSLERFVGGRLSILTDLHVTPTKLGRMTKPYSSHRFIGNCFNAGNLKMEVKAFQKVMGTRLDMSTAYHPETDGVHNMFHVSNLKKCLSDEPLAISLDEVHIDDKLHFIEESVEVMDREVKRCQRNRRVPYDQRNNPPQHPRIVYPPVLDINHFRHFLVTLENLYPMDDEPMWAADRVATPTLGSAITILETANEFYIKGNYLTLSKGNQFDGRTKTDPHKHIHEFLRICNMFKYRDTKNEAIRLMMFTLSLTGEAKTWLDELNEVTIKT
nr:reverse transcriptase domain-containing protein [Tanacetum cinerariifolium]